jgi:hypothetical protein
MSQNDRIAQIIHQWKELSLEEGQGIQTGNWSQVLQCQAGKRGLMLQLDNVRNEFTGDFSSFPEAGELVDLEMHNARELEQARTNARFKRESLNRSARDLRNVRTAYHRPREAGWTSFS